MFFGKVTDYRGQKQMPTPRSTCSTRSDRLQITPIYPQSRQAPPLLEGLPGVGGARACAGPATSSSRCPGWVLDQHDFVDRTGAFRGIHVPESARRARGGPPPARLRRAAAHPAHARHAQAQDRGHQPGHRARHRPASSSGGSSPALPFELTGDQRTVIDEIDRRPGPAACRCTGSCRATSGRARPWSPSPRCSPPCRAATRARSWRRRRCSPSSTRRACGRCSTGISVPDGGASLFDDRPAERRAAHQQGHRQGAPAHPRRPGRAAGRPPRRHPRPDPGGGRLPAASASVVIDEQHRFGVEQRAALRDKAGGGAVPDVLVMTATPIPRTAAMTVYGDLDVSRAPREAGRPAARSPPPGPRAMTEEAEVWATVRDEVAAGRQAYVVCPLIGESDKLEVASAEETHARLEADELLRPVASASCTGGCPPRRRRPRWPASAKAAPTCSWRRR